MGIIYYEIRLEKVTGVGEITGIVYHGGGKILATAKLSKEGTKVRAKTTYRVKYVGDKGNQIFFTQNARFIMVNGETKVEFNNIFDSCKGVQFQAIFNYSVLLRLQVLLLHMR